MLGLLVGIGVLVSSIFLFISFIYILGVFYLIAIDSDLNNHEEIIRAGFHIFVILLVVVTAIFMAYLIGSAILL